MKALFNAFAAGMCLSAAMYSASKGHAWWALWMLSLAFLNAILAYRAYVRTR